MRPWTQVSFDMRGTLWLGALCALMLALTIPVQADPGPSQPSSSCGQSEPSCQQPQPSDPLSDLQNSARRCTTVTVYWGEPRIQFDPVLGIIWVDPDGCIRSVIHT